MMDLGPGFDEALLCPWKRAADTLNRVEGEHRLEFLVSRMEVRPMMGNTDFGKHADDDSKEPREFRHGRTLHRHRRVPGEMSCEELSHVLTEQDEQRMFMRPHIEHLRAKCIDMLLHVNVPIPWSRVIFPPFDSTSQATQRWR